MAAAVSPTTLEVWIDAQLPPTLAGWLARRGITATHVQDLGLLQASDLTIFSQARAADAVIVTKESTSFSYSNDTALRPACSG